MARITSQPSTIRIVGPGVTKLGRVSVSLAVGQCQKLQTHLTGAILTFQNEGSNFIQWGSSGVYDPIRKEVRFIGKRDGPNPYHFLVYDEVADAWSNDRPLWSNDAVFGHGYDHNAINPETGTHYHRPYNADFAYVWNGTWSQTPSWSGSSTVAGGLSWFPGVGLIYSDGVNIRYLKDSSWVTIKSFTSGSYHDVSEYNSLANVLIFGSGNYSPLMKMTSNLEISTVADPPFNVGAGSTQGLLISDPNSTNLIAYKKGSKDWAAYNILADTWSTLTQSQGGGLEPQAGTPNVQTNTTNAVIGIPIPKYGVIMFIQYMGSGATLANVWIYKHA